MLLQLFTRCSVVQYKGHWFRQETHSLTLVLQNQDADVGYCGADSRTALIADLKLVFRFTGFENHASILSFQYLLPFYFHYCFFFQSRQKALKMNL